jgi:hypothetical protein
VLPIDRIGAIERLPEEWQEWSVKEDMTKLLNAISRHPDYYFVTARSHIERRGVAIKAGELTVADREPSGVVTGVFTSTPSRDLPHSE